MEEYKCQLSVKILASCQLSVKFWAICQLSVNSLLRMHRNYSSLARIGLIEHSFFFFNFCV